MGRRDGRVHVSVVRNVNTVPQNASVPVCRLEDVKRDPAEHVYGQQ